MAASAGTGYDDTAIVRAHLWQHTVGTRISVRWQAVLFVTSPTLLAASTSVGGVEVLGKPGGRDTLLILCSACWWCCYSYCSRVQESA
jgi:hypothetical protein